MSLTYLGSLTVGDILPSLGASMAITLPQLQAQIAGLLAAQAQITITPPSIVASLALAANLVASIEAAIALGIELPGLSLQLTVIADFLAVLNLQVALLLSFQVALGTAGVHLYAYDGVASGLGPSIPSSFPGGAPTDATNALLLATSVPAAWAALGVVLKTS